MKKVLKFISVLLILCVSASVLCACFSTETTKSDDRPYITVGSEQLDKEYIGYFFYVAQRNMIQEAGMVLGEGGNSTQEDVDAFWATTEIDGVSAVNAARDSAADNAVIQTVQYLKAVDEGISLTTDDEKEITAQINDAVESSGGQEAFNKQLADMGCNANAYRKILTENMYLQKLYDKYDFEGKLSVSDEELTAYSLENADKVSLEHMLDSAKKDKFSKMAEEWKKEYDIRIDDEKMKEFDVK